MKSNCCLNRTNTSSITVMALAVVALFVFTQSVRASSYTWNVNPGNWSTPGSWTPTTFGAGGPLSTDSVVFGNADTSGSASTVNNTVDFGFAGTVSNLTYNSVASGTYVYDVTQIPVGKTLTAGGSVLVGGQNEGAGSFALLLLICMAAVRFMFPHPALPCKIMGVHQAPMPAPT